MNQKKSIFQHESFQKFLAFGMLILMIIVFSFMDKSFLSISVIINILLATTVTGVLALGITFVLVSGENDLSIGTNMTFSAVVAGIIINKIIASINPQGTIESSGISVILIILAIVIALIVGASVGLFNGFMIAKLKMPAFIATLGTQMIIRGCSLVFSDVKPVYFTSLPMYAEISTGSLVGKVIKVFQLPNAVIVFFALAVLAWFLLSKTLLGRYTFAIGSNEEAARLSGIKTDAWKMGIFALCGAFAGLAGILMSSRLNSAQPAMGVGYELDAIAASVLGGTSLSGGEGSILGALIGAFIMTVLVTGLTINGVNQEAQYIFKGVILLVCVYFDVFRKKNN